ncbi:MAG: tail fiber domain-containing protein, partial [Ferruginibacter sp.]
SRALGNYSIAMGITADASATAAVAIGNGLTASGFSALAMGTLNTASGDFSIAMGSNSNATALSAVAIGNTVNASGNYSNALGRGTTASQENAIAMGFNSNATALSAVAIGNTVNASGNYSTAFGRGTTATQDNTIAMGLNSNATSLSAVAIGNTVNASGNYAVAMGKSTSSSGIASFALGELSTASGQTAIAIGFGTTASGAASTSMGTITAAREYSSTSMGFFTIARSAYSLVTGIYNDTSNTNRLFEIGNGTAFNARSNALTVLTNGNVGIGATNPTKQTEIIGAASATPVTLVIGNRGGFGPAAMEFVSDYGFANQWRPGYIRSNDIGSFTGAMEFYTNGTGAGNLYGNVKGLEVRNGVTYTATGTVSSWSDTRLKKNVQPFTSGLDIINQINPVSFFYNQSSPFQTEKMQVGILAQELEKVAPYMVDKNTTKDFEDLRSVNNQAYIFLLINAVKEQNKKMEDQQKQINEQRKIIEQLLNK